MLAGKQSSASISQDTEDALIYGTEVRMQTRLERADGTSRKPREWQVRVST